MATSLHLGVVAIEKGAFGSPSTTVTNFTLLIWFVLVVKWHTNLHGLFNAKAILVEEQE